MSVLPLPARRDGKVRRNAAIAVDHDPVRRADHLADVRLAAAVILAPRVQVAEALLAGVAVPAQRLAPEWVAALRLDGDVLLDEALALAVMARGPIMPAASNRALRAAA